VLEVNLLARPTPCRAILLESSSCHPITHLQHAHLTICTVVHLVVLLTTQYISSDSRRGSFVSSIGLVFKGVCEKLRVYVFVKSLGTHLIDARDALAGFERSDK
jgi:hypothetical protein